MAITTDTEFTYVVVLCSCENRSVSNIAPVTSLDPLTAATGSESLSMQSTSASKIAQRKIMRDRVRAGTAEMHYYDANEVTLIAHDDLPLRLVPYLHPQHDIHPNDSWELLARMILNGDIKVDSDSGQIEFQLRGNFNTPRFNPTSDEIDYALREWEAVPSITDESRFQFDLELSHELQVTSSNIDDVAPLRAMRNWMQSIKASGSDFATDSFLTPASWTSRSITIEDGATDDTDIVATLQGVATVADDDGYYIKFSLVCSVPATEDYDINNIDRQLASEEISISTTDLEIESTLGNTQNPLMGSRVEFGGGGLHFDGGAPYTAVTDDDSAIRRRIFLGNSRIAYYTDLTLFSSKYLMPTPKAMPMVEEIHVDGLTADVTIKALTPPLMAGRVNNVRPISIHNNDDTYDVVVEDWDNDNVTTLAPGTACYLRFGYRKNGKGSMTGQVDPRVLLSNSDLLSTVFNDIDRYTFDDDAWVRRVSLIEAGVQQQDTDAFEINTTIQAATGSPPDQFNATNIVQTFNDRKILKAGRIDFFRSHELELTSASASLGAETALRLYRKRDTTLSLISGFAEGRLFSGNGNTRNYSCAYHGMVEADDIFIPIFYYPSSGSASIGDIDVLNIHEYAVLNQTINKQFTPGS